MEPYRQIERPAASAIGAEQAALKAMAAKRKPEDIARFQWWGAGGAVYRWNEMILDEMQLGFVTLPLSVRHLALFHAALDDAVAAAWHYKGGYRPAGRCRRAWCAQGQRLEAGVAVGLCRRCRDAGLLVPARAAEFAAKAEEDRPMPRG